MVTPRRKEKVGSEEGITLTLSIQDVLLYSLVTSLDGEVDKTDTDRPAF